MIDWDDLRHALAVARAGSVTKAASALGVDKATVSRRIASLEEALGVLLFSRAAGRWSPTPAGAALLAGVAEMSQRVDDLVAAASRDDTRLEGLVTLTAPPFFLSEVLAPALPGFRAEHPRIELAVVASQAVLNLAQREADVAVRTGAQAQMSLSVRRAGKIGMALYASRPYLAERGRPRDQNLVGHTLLSFDPVYSGPSFAWLPAAAARAETALRANDVGILHAAARAGLGIATLPCLLGDRDPELVRATKDHGVDSVWLASPPEVAGLARVRAVSGLIVELFERNAAAFAGVARSA